MPHPSTVHTDTALSTWISSYENGDYMADMVSPIIETSKRSDVYQKFSRRDASTVLSTRLGPTTKANVADYSITTGNYSVLDYGLVGYVSRSEMADADAPHNPKEKRARFVMNAIMLDREVRVATQLLATGSYASGNTAAATAVWSNESTGVPLTDIQTGIAAIAPGMLESSKLVGICSLETWHALRKHPQMLGGGSLRPVLSLEEAAAILGLDELHVSNAQQQTANPGATASYSRIWTTTKFVMVRIPKGEPQGEAGLFSATFRFNGGESGQPVEVRTWDEPKLGRGGSEAIQVELSDDEVVVQNDMGYLITSVL